MCDTCGCEQATVQITMLDANTQKQISHPSHNHTHEHHHHDHNHSSTRDIAIEQDLLNKNQLYAERVRGYLQAKQILALNLVSSPGSGKTTLLEKTLRDLQGDFSFSVIEGDQQTLNDAQRIQQTGCKVVQINTGQGCHLDANMIYQAVSAMNPEDNGILFIENVGNLVCPALFDLGEQQKIVIISVTEGTDKPLKYPTMFKVSGLCLINKIDLLPYVDFDMDRFKEYALKINPHLQIIALSAKSGQGMELWYQWLKERKNRE